jgi:hypothetical protein
MRWQLLTFPNFRKGDKTMRNRKIFQFGLVVLAIVLLGALSTSSARAAVVENRTIPIEETIWGTLVNPCNGNTITLTGNIHELIAETFDHSGGAHFKYHLQTEGVSGIDNVTSDVYKVIMVGSMQENYIGAGDFPYTSTSIANMHFIGRGSAPDFDTQLRVHLTVNANGETTSEFSIANETCSNE